MRFLRNNWFVLGLVGAFLCAVLCAQELRSIDPMGSVRARIRDLIVVIIFLAIGSSLPSERILGSMLRPRLYVVTQLTIFVFVPLLMAGFTLVPEWVLGIQLFPASITTGLLALSVLPTTGSSCVVFTQAAQGNTIAATVNSTLSNIVGVLVSPLLLSLLLNTGGRALPIDRLVVVLVGLTRQMVLPLLIGQMLRAFLIRMIRPPDRFLREATSAMIVAVVFLSTGIALDGGYTVTGDTVSAVLFLLLFYPSLVAVVALLARVARLDGSDRSALVFTGTHKTLALGIPLLSLYFADQPDLLSAALTPLIFYHLLQLLFGGLLANAIARRTAE